MSEKMWTPETGVRPIPGWDGYAATPDGRIWSISSNWRGYGARELSQDLDTHSYPSVRLKTAVGVRKRLKVHRLVAETFIGKRPTPQHEVRHLDGDRSNNRVENLAWGTPKENAADRTAHGRQAEITPEWRAKMTAGTRAYHATRAALRLAQGGPDA